MIRSDVVTYGEAVLEKLTRHFTYERDKKWNRSDISSVSPIAHVDIVARESPQSPCQDLKPWHTVHSCYLVGERIFRLQS
jgi:hypothetical protein